MTITENPNAQFSFPNDVGSIIDSLGLQLDPKMKRKLVDAIALLQANNQAVEDRIGGTSSGWPVLTDDPSNPSDGDAWVNQTAGKARIRISGSTVDLN